MRLPNLQFLLRRPKQQETLLQSPPSQGGLSIVRNEGYGTALLSRCVSGPPRTYAPPLAIAERVGQYRTLDL